MEAKNDWHLISDREALDRMSVDMYKGLSDSEVSKRRRKYGSNRIWHIRHSSALKIAGESVFDIATVLLIISAVCAAMFDKSYEAGLITAILLIGAAIRAVTFIRANTILEETAKAKIPVSSVIRGGRIKLISASQIVPGDIIFLEPGDTVPCDGRVISSGESSVIVLERGITENKTTVKKFNTVIKLGNGSHDVPCEFRSNMIFAGSTVVSGSIRMLAVSTGSSALVSMKQGGIELNVPEIPAIEKLKSRSRSTSLFMLACVIVLTALSMFAGRNGSANLPGVFLSSLAMAVAAMSEFLTVIGYIIFSVTIRDCADLKWNRSENTAASRAVIRNPEVLDKLDSAERIIFCGTSFFKSGDAVISAYRTSEGYVSGTAGGKMNGDRKLERLLCFAQAASVSMNNSLSSGVGEIKLSHMGSLCALAADHYVRLTKKNLNYEYAMADHRGSEADGSMGMETSLVVTEGDYYLIGCGKIDDVMRCCNTYETENGAEELTYEIRKKIFTECARLEISGGRVAAVAKRQSQFSNLTRLPALTQYMTFVGYFVLSEKEETGAKENAAYLRESGIVPIIFSRNSQADYYYCQRLRIFDKSAKAVSAGEILSSADEIIVPDGGMLVSFEGISDSGYPSTAAEVMKRLGGGNTIAVGRSVHDSGVLSEAQFGIAAARGSVRTVPETLSKNSCAVVYPKSEATGGLCGTVRVLKSARRAVNNIDFANFYLTASQSARLAVMLISVLFHTFSLPSLSPVFILLWGIIFDFAAVLVMAFTSFSAKPKEPKKVSEPMTPIFTGAVWGILLSLSSALSLYVTGSPAESTSILAGGAIISALAAAELIKQNFSGADMLFTLTSAALASFLTLTETGAKLSSGSPCSYSALLSLIPAAVITALFFILRQIPKLISKINEKQKDSSDIIENKK